MRLKAVFSRCKDVQKTEIQGTAGRGSAVRSVYPTQDTSRMRTARVKQENEANNRIIVKE